MSNQHHTINGKKKNKRPTVQDIHQQLKIRDAPSYSMIERCCIIFVKWAQALFSTSI